jgi:hypothetical protein
MVAAIVNMHYVMENYPMTQASVTGKQLV